MKYWSLILAATFTCNVNPIQADQTYSEIEDLADLPLLSRDLAERQTAKLRLSNGLEVLLISDPKADQSAATVAVGVGSWNDPKEFPGMAHFCEHMLFMGTGKYPDTNDFMTQISNYDGQANAFTAPDRTVYMFSARTVGFLDLLDRFAHFFIDPLFNVSNISREMHAVDQEFALQKDHDGWREYMVFKETGNPSHPNCLFSAGNSKTLSHIPQSALKEWHAERYSADRIRVALYSSLPLSEMKEAAAAFFSAVPKSALPMPTFDAPLSSPKQQGHMIVIEPIQDRQKLSLVWELPPELSNDPSLSADLVAYALSRGQKYSLYEKLKAEELIDNLRIHTEDQGGNVHTFFEIDAELSNKGIQSINLVIERIFQAIEGLKAGIPELLFREKNKVAQLFYQYQTRVDAFSFISSIGRNLLDEEMATYPRKILLAEGYHPQKIEAVLAFLTPNRCIFTLMAPSKITKTQYSHTEKWLSVPYSIETIPIAWQTAWNAAKPNPDIKIADPNPFVPSQLAIVPDQNLGKVPSLFASSEFGTAYYVRSPEFQTPETAIHLRIVSAALDKSVRSQVLASLYIDHITDQIHATLKAAASAGLFAYFSVDRGRLHIEIAGFSDKAPLLLQEILKEMPLHPPTEEQFSVYVSRHEKDYANGQKEQAFKQARELASSLINTDRTTRKEKLEALRAIAYADLVRFHEQLFAKTYSEALFSGNLSLKAAESSWLDVLHLVSKQPYPKTEHPQTKALQLPDAEGPLAIKESIGLQGNAALLLIDQGAFTFEKRAAQEILSSALHEAFFDTLRTKQKTGYVAQTNDVEFERHLYQTFLVQSNSHQPEDLLHRFELFLEEYGHEFQKNITQERFQILKESAIDSLKTRYRNLRDKSALWDRLAFDEKSDFHFIEKRVDGLKQLDYARFSTLCHEFISRANRKRLAILVEGKLHHPFTYKQKTLQELARLATYSPRPPADLAEGAAIESTNSVVERDIAITCEE